jgi:hypothetical protein
MKTLERQLLEYGTFHEREQGTLSIDDATQVPAPLVVAQSVDRRPWVVVAAAAAAVLILIGGIGLLTRLGTDSDTPPAEEQVEPDQSLDPPRLTDSIPPELESGTFATPAGDARWVRLNGSESSLPWGTPIAWPTGFAMIQRPELNYDAFPGFDVVRPARLWVSPDGIEWHVEPTPISDEAESVSLTLVDGEYWLISTNPERMWRSTDGMTWDELDPVGFAPPGPAGLNMHIQSHTSPVSLGDVTILYADFVGWFPAEQFGLPQVCAERPVRVEDGVYRMTGDEQCPQGGPVLHFVEAEAGLQVLDNETGELLGEILGADLSHVEAMAKTDELHIQNLIIIENGEVTQVGTPWEHFYPRLFASEDWLYAYVQSIEDLELTVWRSNDGRSWTNLGPPSYLQDTPAIGFHRFWPLENSMAVTTFVRSENGAESDVAWETTDGVTWIPMPTQPPPGAHVVRLESGWFATDESNGGRFGGDVWSMLIDGTWISLADLGMEHAEPGCGVEAAAVENTTFFLGDCGPMQTRERSLWIVSLDPSD